MGSFFFGGKDDTPRGNRRLRFGNTGDDTIRANEGVIWSSTAATTTSSTAGRDPGSGPAVRATTRPTPGQHRSGQRAPGTTPSEGGSALDLVFGDGSDLAREDDSIDLVFSGRDDFVYGDDGIDRSSAAPTRTPSGGSRINRSSRQRPRSGQGEHQPVQQRRHRHPRGNGGIDVIFDDSEDWTPATASTSSSPTARTTPSSAAERSMLFEARERLLLG